MTASSLVLRHPIGLSLLAFGLLLAGIWACSLLGITALPSIESPVITVSAQLEGASAQTTATTVTSPLERRLGRLPGLTSMESDSRAGAAEITLTFQNGGLSGKSVRDVQAAINAAAVDLPSNMVDPPQYFRADTSAFPVVLIAVTSDSLTPDRMFDLADTTLRPAISQVPGVAQVSVFGGSPHAVRVELDTSVLAARGLTSNDVKNALLAANVASPLGVVEDGGRRMTIAINDAVLDPRDFSNLVIAVRDGVPVKLGDVANVAGGQRDRFQSAWFNGKPAVALQVSKLPDANSIAVVDAITKAIPRLSKGLPASVQVTPIFDVTQTTNSALHEVEVALAMSIVMVALVMLAFLRRVRPTMIAMVSVPLALAGALVAMWAMHYTLNLLSLVALVLCTGFVVDDAIVVIENTARHIAAGADGASAAEAGLREIRPTVISMTLALLAVFVPLIFGTGRVPELLREFSVTLSVAIIFSAVVALTVTPALCGRYLGAEDVRGGKPGRLQQMANRAEDAVVRTYEVALDWAMRHRRAMRWQPILLAGLTVFLYQTLQRTAGSGFMPQQDTGHLHAAFTADANVSPEALATKARELTTIMLADPAIEDVTTTLGQGDGDVGNTGNMFMDLKPVGSDPGMRSEGIRAVAERLRHRYATVPGVSIALTPLQYLSSGGGGGGAGGMSYQLVSTDGTPLQPWVLALASRLRRMSEFRDVESDFDTVGYEQRLIVDRDQASRLGVTMGDVDSVLANALGQRPVSMIYADSSQYWTVLSSVAAGSLRSDDLLNLHVRGGSGAMLPLSTFANVGPGLAPTTVHHFNQLESAAISYNLGPGVSQGKAIELIDQASLSVGVPRGIQADLTGDNQWLQESRIGGMTLVLTAVAVVYIVLGMLYEGLGHPLTVLSTLPAASVGAFLAMFVTRTQMTTMATIAVLLLVGIVMKNAIMMVDFAISAERHRGLSPSEAIREAALLRFRPILMTTLAALGSAAPLAFGVGVGSEMRQPLGIAILGGLVVSQCLTVLSTPAVYLWNHDRIARRAMRSSRRTMPLFPRRNSRPQGEG
jgi:multidrug efflux pump